MKEYKVLPLYRGTDWKKNEEVIEKINRYASRGWEIQEVMVTNPGGSYYQVYDALMVRDTK